MILSPPTLFLILLFFNFNLFSQVVNGQTSFNVTFDPSLQPPPKADDPNLRYPSAQAPSLSNWVLSESFGIHAKPKTRVFDWEVSWRKGSPDGFEKPVIAINGLVPGWVWWTSSLDFLLRHDAEAHFHLFMHPFSPVPFSKPTKEIRSKSMSRTTSTSLPLSIGMDCPKMVRLGQMAFPDSLNVRSLHSLLINTSSNSFLSEPCESIMVLENHRLGWASTDNTFCLVFFFSSPSSFFRMESSLQKPKLVSCSFIFSVHWWSLWSYDSSFETWPTRPWKGLRQDA